MRNEEQKHEQSGDADKRGSENEEPYETAYIRWRMQMAMKKAIKPDGSVFVDENKYMQELKDRAGDQRRLSSSMMSGNWTELGPIESFDDNNAGPGFDQANVYCIAIAPSNDNLLYCGTEDGAIFKTIDKDLHWTCVSNALPANAPVSIAIDPVDENIVYVRLSSTILKTIDGGTNWTVLGFNGGSAEKLLYFQTPVLLRLVSTKFFTVIMLAAVGLLHQVCQHWINCMMYEQVHLATIQSLCRVQCRICFGFLFPQMLALPSQM